MKKENAATHPIRDGLEKVKEVLESVISTDAEIGESTVSQWNAEMESAKAEFKKKFPTYPELLEAAARARVMSLKALAPLPMLLGQHFENLIKSSESLPGVDAQNNVTTAEIEVYMEMIRGSVEIMSNVHLNKVRREHKLTNSSNGSKGQEKRDEKFAPLREKAMLLVKSKKYGSARQAGYEIAKQIVDTPEFRNSGLREHNAPNTIADWFRKAGVKFSEDV